MRPEDPSRSSVVGPDSKPGIGGSGHEELRAPGHKGGPESDLTSQVGNVRPQDGTCRCVEGSENDTPQAAGGYLARGEHTRAKSSDREGLSKALGMVQPQDLAG